MRQALQALRFGFAKMSRRLDDRPMAESNRVPLVHITDLYHPPQDPDDQFDLATVLALPELELKAVLFDVTRKFLVPVPVGWDDARDPGLILTAQAGYLRGASFPTAVGPQDPLSALIDDVSNRAKGEQSAIELLLTVLREASHPVAVSMVGSARILAATYLRAPELVRENVASVWLNAGSTAQGELEWNVTLDPVAYRILWDSGLPIRWFPCATKKSAFDPEPERGTHWSATHETLLAGLPAHWRGWFAYGLSGSARGDILRATEELGQGAGWENLQAARRSMWSTASLVMMTGRELIRTERGWRFVTESREAGSEPEAWPWRLDPIEAAVGEDAQITWSETTSPTPHRLFGRRPGADYGVAMAEALNALLVENLN
jgi:pyrimidine-specific ribonucleoside hydrolase